MVRDLRDDLLRSLPEADPHRDVIELLTSFEGWDRLRTDQKLGREKAQRAIERALSVLLLPGSRAGSRSRRS